MDVGLGIVWLVKLHVTRWPVDEDESWQGMSRVQPTTTVTGHLISGLRGADILALLLAIMFLVFTSTTKNVTYKLHPSFGIQQR